MLWLEIASELAHDKQCIENMELFFLHVNNLTNKALGMTDIVNYAYFVCTHTANKLLEDCSQLKEKSTAFPYCAPDDRDILESRDILAGIHNRVLKLNNVFIRFESIGTINDDYRNNYESLISSIDKVRKAIECINITGGRGLPVYKWKLPVSDLDSDVKTYSSWLNAIADIYKVNNQLDT